MCDDMATGSQYELLVNSKSSSQILKDTLADWASPDIAAYKLACALGILPPENGSFEGFRDAKALFGAASPLGDVLGSTLDRLAEAGVLEFEPNRLKYRWNTKFKGFWE